jgi:hypothetical protein
MVISRPLDVVSRQQGDILYCGLQQIQFKENSMSAMFMSRICITIFVIGMMGCPCIAATADEPDAFHVSETKGPFGFPITKPILTGRDIESTTVQGPATPDAAVKASSPRNISLNHGSPQPGVDTDLIINPQGRYALMAYFTEFGDKPLSVQRVDLANADSGKVLPLANDLRALAISPDGKRVVTRSEKSIFPATRWRLDLWSLDDSAAKPLLSFRAYDRAENGADAVSWASFLDARHLMTSSASHTLTLWEISDTSATEIYTLQGDGTVAPQMSPGGKYVIVGVDGSILVCEAMTGKCVSKCTAFNDGGDMVVSLRPDVQRLALASQHRLVICDLQKDKLLLDVGLPEKATGVIVDWIDPHLVLIDNTNLFDVDHHTMLWEYENAGAIPLGHWMGDRLAYQSIIGAAFPGGPGHCNLNSFAIPDDKIRQAQKHLQDGEFLVRPGTSVSLEVNGIDGDFRQKLIDHFTRRLTDNGLTVADGQPIKLVVESKSVDSHNVQYRSNGRNPQNESVTISDTVLSISYVMDSKPLWSTDSVTRGSAPIFVFRKKDQSISDAVNEMNKPKYQWFLSTGIPATILKPADPAGSSPFGQIGGRTRNSR